jgi:hypothetical protein
MKRDITSKPKVHFNKIIQNEERIKNETMKNYVTVKFNENTKILKFELKVQIKLYF